MTAAHRPRPVKRDVLVGAIAALTLLSTAAIVFGGGERAGIALSLGIVIVGCVMLLGWLVSPPRGGR